MRRYTITFTEDAGGDSLDVEADNMQINVCGSQENMQLTYTFLVGATGSPTIVSAVNEASVLHVTSEETA
jgi:hypothetical protein